MNVQLEDINLPPHSTILYPWILFNLGQPLSLGCINAYIIQIISFVLGSVSSRPQFTLGLVYFQFTIGWVYYQFTLDSVYFQITLELGFFPFTLDSVNFIIFLFSCVYLSFIQYLFSMFLFVVLYISLFQCNIIYTCKYYVAVNNINLYLKTELGIGFD